MLSGFVEWSVVIFFIVSLFIIIFSILKLTKGKIKNKILKVIVITLISVPIAYLITMLYFIVVLILSGKRIC